MLRNNHFSLRKDHFPYVVLYKAASGFFCSTGLREFYRCPKYTLSLQTAIKGFGKAVRKCNRAQFRRQRCNTEGAFELGIGSAVTIRNTDTWYYPTFKWDGVGRREGSTDKGETLSQAQEMVYPHLTQHVILLHVVDLPRAYFPFERILKELPADVD